MAGMKGIFGFTLFLIVVIFFLPVNAQYSNCVTCHNISAPISTGRIDVSAMNLSSNASHRNVTEGIVNQSVISDNVVKACWACHWNGTDPNETHANKTTFTPWDCADCHANNTGGVDSSTDKGNYSATATYSHVPSNSMGNFSSPTNINTSIQCQVCHNNSLSAYADTGGSPENNTINSTVSHYATNVSLVVSSGTNCTFCHVQPNANTRAIWGTNVSLGAWPTSNVSFRGNIRHETNVSHCDNCHGNLSSPNTFHSNQLKKDISVHYAFDWEGDDGIDGGALPPYPNREESCIACHNNMTFGGAKQFKICEDCHLPNGIGPFTGPIPVGGPAVMKYNMRSDLTGWNISDRVALGIPIIYSHVPYNQIQNSTTGISVTRNLSGETGESGMSTQSSCFSWNPATPNGSCHGVGYSLRLAATPPEDVALGKEYFMHYGEKELGTVGIDNFNVTYMNTYIQDYSPNTSDCFFCHNQSNVSVRRFWGNAMLIYYNRSNQSQYIGPSLMYNGTSRADCYNCHTISGTAPSTFHVQELTFGGGSDCVSCHDVGLTSAADVDVVKMNLSASPFSLHRRLNNQTGDPGFSSTSFTGNNDSKRCWACHSNGSEPSNMGLNYLTPWLCYDCHTNTTGGINTTTLKGNYSAPSVFAHIPANAMGNYSSAYQTNFTTGVQCWICHNNSVANTLDSEPGPQLGHTAKSNVSHYGVKTFLVSNSAQNCTFCHVQPNATIRAMWGTNAPLGAWPTSNVSFRGNIRHETNVSHCDNCHGNLSSANSLHSNQLEKDISVHYAFDWEGDDATDGGALPPYPNREESCIACHNNMSFGGAKQYKICEDCHLPNGTGPFTGPIPVGGPAINQFYLRSDLTGWNISDREALGIPIIYSHVPYNSVWNVSDVQVKRNLSGETGESGMSTQSSCFSWNPATPNGSCHGVGYSLRLAATPSEDVALGKEYFMHYGEKEYGTVGSDFYNVTYMNTYIQDYAPNTSDCLFCHNQSNVSVRLFWGNAIQVKLNSTGGYDSNAMYGAQSNTDCYLCHVDSRSQPKTFHEAELNPGLNCEICHFNYTLMNNLGKPSKWINETLFNTSVHGNRSIMFCTNCHTMTEGHPPPESRWHWCEDCHVVMPQYADGTPIKAEQQRHNMTFQPQYSMMNVSGTMTSVINITDCTFCHDTAAYNQARAIFNKTSGKNCRYCHSFPDLNIDSPY